MNNRVVKKKQIIMIISVIILAAAFFFSIIFGSVNVSISDFFVSVREHDYNLAVFRIVFYIRLPRAIAAMLSGMALAVSGVIIQAVLNNSLAAPNIIGVNAGAGFAALLIIGVFGNMLYLLPVAAMMGAVLTSLLIYGIAAKTGASRMTITMAGITISSILTAGMNTIKTLFPDSIYNANSFLIGGFSGVTYSNIGYTWILIVCGIIMALLLAKDIDVLMMGEDTAKSLGMNVKLLRFILIIDASVLAGCAVSFSGLLGFVGLIIPHMIRRLVGTEHRLVIFVSIFMGAAFVLICDLLSRIVAAPYELPVGIILSFVGGPFFLYLILDRRKGNKL